MIDAKVKGEREEEREWERKKIEFEKALELRGFEIDNFWKRGWFFGALLLALLGGYFKLRGGGEDFHKYCICVAFMAFLVSLAQSLMNRGSKYWQERWEYVTKNRESKLGISLTKARKIEKEKDYIDACILAKDENWIVRSKRFSVSKITILMWDVITIFCFLVWLDTFHFRWAYFAVHQDWSHFFECLGYDVKPIIFHVLIIGYLLLIVFRKDSLISEELKKSVEQDKNQFFADSEAYVNDEFEKTNG